MIKDSVGQYLIRCNLNGSCIGLTWLDGVTMNGDEADAEEAIKEAIGQEYYRSSDYDDGEGTTVVFEGRCAEVQVESCYLSAE